MSDQSTWPAHLRDDAAYRRCGRCQRKTWDIADFGKECRMPQPDGYPCGGKFDGSTLPAVPSEMALLPRPPHRGRPRGHGRLGRSE